MVERWCMRVPVCRGEETRRALLSYGVLDLSYRVRREADALILPLAAWREGSELCDMEQNPDRPDLPRHELVGGIAVMQEEDAKGAERILASRPSLHTVLYQKSEVLGEYRTREFSVLAGTGTTRTMVTEYGHRLTVDLSLAYFSARLSSERQRVLGMTGRGEMLLDMFAGVGPFAITLAGRAALVVACDINPGAVFLMQENCWRNRTPNVLPVFGDARHLAGILPWQFDRVIMNLPLAGTEFLGDAFRLCRPGGAIHFYALVSEEGEHTASIRGLGGTVRAERIVRSYSPGQWHAVYDIIRIRPLP